MEYNVRQNIPNAEEGIRSGSITVKGHLWGSNTNELLECSNNEKYDVIILADLLFNHQGHVGLLKTCQDCLAPNGKVF
jgi:nicotinamide N-methyltransferase